MLDVDTLIKVLTRNQENFGKKDEQLELMKILDIPVHGTVIRLKELYEILSHPEKCKILISKLRMKAFW